MPSSQGTAMIVEAPLGAFEKKSKQEGNRHGGGGAGP